MRHANVRVRGEGRGEGVREVPRGIRDRAVDQLPKLTACPDCGGPIFRVIQAPGLGHSKTDLHYRAKRAGFSCLKKVQKGEYEKVF